MTSADQFARVRDTEIMEPMFPKGVKQMLGFIYAMEGEPAGGMSWHARMIDMRDYFERGYITPFPLHRINMTGLEPIMISGECAGLRSQVEDMLTGRCKNAVLAKFGKDYIGRTAGHVSAMAMLLQGHLSTGRRRMARSIEYCTDIVWSVTSSNAAFEAKYNPTKISRRYQVGQGTVWKDCDEGKRLIASILSDSYKKIEKKFCDGVVLPCVTE